MPQVPLPLSAEDTDELKTQIWELIRSLYEDRIAGLEIGDVFQDAGDVLTLRLHSTGGLEKTSNQLAVKLDGATLHLSADGIRLADNAGGTISDVTYGASWNGVTNESPSKNAVYDAMEKRVEKATFNAETFLYATTDNLPEAKTPAEVMAILRDKLGVLEAYRQGLIVSRKSDGEIYVSAGTVENSGQMCFAKVQLIGSNGNHGYLNQIDSYTAGTYDAFARSWGDGTYIYVPNSNGSLRSFSIDECGALTFLAYGPRNAVSCWGDGNFIYLVGKIDDTYSICSYSASEGVLTKIDSYTLSYPLGVWGDGNFIYVSDNNSGLHSFSVDGSGNLTHLDSHDPGGNLKQVWGDGTFIFMTSLEGLHSYSVDGSGNLTHKDSDYQGDQYYGVWGDDNFIYVAGRYSGLHSYEIETDGNLIHLDSHDPGGETHNVWSDGTFVYLTDSSNDKFYSYSVDGSGNLSPVDTVTAIDQPGALWGYGKFIYLSADKRFYIYEEIKNTGSYSASTVYHVYISLPVSGDYLSTDEIILSTDVPVFTDAKGAKYRSGVTNQRWIGSFKTDGSGHISHIIQPRRLNVKTDSDEEPNTGDVLVYDATNDWYVPTTLGERLLESGTVNLQNGDGKTTVYTVPTGKKGIVTQVIIFAPTASLAGGIDFDIGDGANADTWRTEVDLSSLTASGDCIVIQGTPTVKFPIFDAGDEFGIKPVTGATLDADATMYVFGFEY